MPLERRSPCAAPAAFEDEPPHRGHHHEHPASRRSSTVSIERLNDGDEQDDGRMPRRRSSNISFEKHNSVVLEQLMACLDDDSSDDEGSLEGIPTAEEAPELDPANEASSTSLRGNSASSSGCNILSEIEDQILEQGVRSGKLVLEDDDPQEETTLEQQEQEENLATAGHDSLRSTGSSASWRRGSLTRRTSFARRGSVGSAAGATRRFSFTGRRQSTGSTMSASSTTSRGSFRAGPSLHDDITAALRDLAADDDSEDNDDAAIARAVLATGGSMAVEVEVELASPPPRGTPAPRRSSLKRPGARRNWSGRSIGRGGASA